MRPSPIRPIYSLSDPPTPHIPWRLFWLSLLLTLCQAKQRWKWVYRRIIGGGYIGIWSGYWAQYWYGFRFLVCFSVLLPLLLLILPHYHTLTNQANILQSTSLLPSRLTPRPPPWPSYQWSPQREASINPMTTTRTRTRMTRTTTNKKMSPPVSAYDNQNFVIDVVR